MPAGRYCKVIESRAAGRRAQAERSRRSRWSPAALVLCAVLTSGCGAAVWEDARSETEEAAHEVSALREAAERPRFSAIRVIERRPWLGLARQDARKEDALPARFLEPGAVTLPLFGMGDASVLARRVEAATGIQVGFAGPAHTGEESSRPNSTVAFGIDRLSPDGGVWTGPLDALLDAWTEPAGYAWRYDGGEGVIEIVRRESAVFRINALAGSQRYAASGSTDDAASGGDEGGGVLTRQSIAAETDYDPWPEIEAQARALAGPGATVTAAPSSASVLVSGTPRDVDRVRGFLRHLNREVLRPVTLSVHVYTVRMEREADYGFGLAALVRELFGTSAQLAVSPESVAVVKPSAAVGDGDTDGGGRLVVIDDLGGDGDAGGAAAARVLDELGERLGEPGIEEAGDPVDGAVVNAGPDRGGDTRAGQMGRIGHGVGLPWKRWTERRPAGPKRERSTLGWLPGGPSTGGAQGRNAAATCGAGRRGYPARRRWRYRGRCRGRAGRLRRTHRRRRHRRSRSRRC